MIRRPLTLAVLALGSALTLALFTRPTPAQVPGPDGLNPSRLAERLRSDPKGDDALKLADALRRWFGGADALKKGPGPKVEEATVAWAVEAPGASSPPRVVFEGGSIAPLILRRLGDTDVYAASLTFPEGAGMRWSFQVGGATLPHPVANPRQAAAAAQLEVYPTHPDGLEKPGVPKGKLTQKEPFQSKVFEGTTRDWWVYVPAQYLGETPAAVMIFQDGGGYKDYVPTVFDNLIADRSMPITVGVFLNPGTFAGGRSNRSFEYDTLSSQYARFLLEEVLPEVEKTVKLRHDAAGRATAGLSSGGICAWTVAWERPEEFSKVLSWIGLFTNIAAGPTRREGGHNYEALIRKTPPKPIRVFLQDGSNDLDNANGNWPLANQQMTRSLAFSKYDSKFVYGSGFHSNKHGRAILPDSLRWLWRGWEGELPK